MRIAVVSDIHGNLPALEAVVADIKRRGADTVVNLGDSLSGPLLPLETSHFLMAQAWTHLAGNHERQLLTVPAERQGASDAFAYSRLTALELDWLASQTSSARYSDEVWLCHGTPASDVEYFLETVEPTRLRHATVGKIDERAGSTEASLILCGHTHLPRAVRASDGRLIVNPGSVGLPAYDDVHPCPHVVETGSPDARYAIVERLAGQWSASLISVPYPHRSMEKLARDRKRPDWAHALSSGFMPRPSSAMRTG